MGKSPFSGPWFRPRIGKSSFLLTFVKWTYSFEKPWKMVVRGHGTCVNFIGAWFTLD